MKIHYYKEPVHFYDYFLTVLALKGVFIARGDKPKHNAGEGLYF